MLKKFFKYLLITIGVIFTLLVCSFIHFIMVPSDEQQLENEYGALAYTELLTLAKVSTPNPDVYAASQITPDNPLFEGVLALQHEQYGDAWEALKPLAEAGDPDAMFWFAETINGSSIIASRDAGIWFDKAAQLGNPYAARWLIPKTSNCEGAGIGLSICREKWIGTSLAMFAERAKNGNTMDIYFDAYRNPIRGTEADYHTKIKLVTKAAKGGYYAPLYRAIVRVEKDENITPEKRQAIVDLLTLAANDNFIPAMEKLIFAYKNDLDKIDFSNIRLKAEIIGSRSALLNVHEELIKKVESGEDLSSQYDLYRISLIEGIFSDLAIRVYTGAEGRDFPILNKDKKQQARVAADKFISEMTPVIYIDEMHTIYL